MNELRLRASERDALNALTSFWGMSGKPESTAANLAIAFLALLNDYRAVLRCVSTEGQSSDAPR